MSSKARELANLGNAYSDGALSNRNLIINGAMQVAQRGTSFDPQGTASAEGYTVDRFAWVRREETGSGFTFDATITQESDAPSHFDKSLKVASDAAQTLSGSENAIITTKFEGQTLQQFGWGTSDAKPLTLSFWVKSNKTGTYCVQTRYNNHSDSGLFEYSVGASSVWEHKTITIPANTSISFNSNNTLEMELMFHLAVGPDDIAVASPNTGTDFFRATSNQVNLFDATSNYWQITGVQLEVGDTATPFEHRSYGQELALCQRYYETDDAEGSDDTRISMNKGTTASAYYWSYPYKVTKRALPTVTINQTYNNNLTLQYSGGSATKSHMGLSNTTGGSTDTRALAEFNWTADAEL